MTYVYESEPVLRYKGKGSTDDQLAVGSPPFPDIVLMDYHKPTKTIRVKDKYGTLLKAIHVAGLTAETGQKLPTVNGDMEAIYDPINSGVKLLVEVKYVNEPERDQFILDTGVRWR